jgi:C4-dicarboxylate-specific signal transduction histidine kinase
MKNIVLNLVMNAIEAMSSDASRSKTLRVGTQRDVDAHILVAVEDSGPGLDPLTIDQIFEPFFTRPMAAASGPRSSLVTAAYFASPCRRR